MAALILAISRAIGETMVVAIAGGATGGSLRHWSTPRAGPDDDRGHGGVSQDRAPTRPGGDLAFPSLFFVGSMLFLITLTLNMVADRFVRRVRQRY